MEARVLTITSLIFFSTLTQASESTSPDPSAVQSRTAVSLTELSRNADIVALAQVKDTDYIYTRSFPSGGSAFLKILIAYKTNLPAGEIIEVYEKGLHANECYFENPTVFEEGRRYMVFLRIDPEDSGRYRALPEGCALEVFVTAQNRYALKYPVDGIKITDKLDRWAKEIDYHDNYALLAEDDLSPPERNKLLAENLIVSYQDGYKFTHGVDLTTARSQIGEEALKRP